ncbi:MAG TPA: CDP-alcohol phosphatidyltransferase family protein [Burkholderiales bacterium]
MPSIYQLKPAFQNLLRPIVRALADLGVTPNQVTLAALALSVAVGLIVSFLPAYHGVLLLVPLTMFLRMALNAIDGMLAREHDMQTVFGGFLNELADVLSDCALYLPFTLVLPAYGWLVVTLVLAAVIGEYAGVIAQALGGSRRYDGPMGKSDRAFIFGLISLLLGLGMEAGRWCGILLLATVALAIWTIVNRVRRGVEEIGQNKKS